MLLCLGQEKDKDYAKNYYNILLKGLVGVIRQEKRCKSHLRKEEVKLTPFTDGIIF